MSELLKQLEERSGNACELCGATDSLEQKVHLDVYEVPDSPKNVKDTSILACETCRTQLEDESLVDPNHWRALNDSMWSPVPAVQVVVYRMLDQLRPHGWPVDLIDMMYMEEDTKQWAEDGIQRGPKIIHKDVNGNILQRGDSIVLIKDLDVKGAGFTAKRGTPVRNITLVYDNAGQVEGRVNGINIVILTEYVKKTSKDE
ncbi:phosphonoacetate hydrolase [Nonlabens dokdonensis]|jgi:protein PhnA|uniref:Alkylphosphonate uptake protein PhnA n=2 Tax=Nonlabens dokdonensis TaxID=328515 RepID=L7WH92_NONDD|nr:alkylphosphonate utilization protein [Nonlabens dokdonensis]AGC78328.1 alkylphosphonate uptake protein PhnA [Nonlabens dokdonensis DSW-6]PZX37787.1 phosphonoacetate hydrolase [Nonlabens dokdonensis]